MSAPPPDPTPSAAAAPEALRVRLVRGVGWNLVATVFNQGSTLALNVVLANLWGARLFGQFAIVQSTIAAITAGAQAIVATAATRYAAELRTSDRVRAGRVLGLCGIAAAALALVAGGGLSLAAAPIASRLLGDATLTTALTVVGAVVVFTIVSGFLTGALAGLEAYAALGRTGVVAGTAYVLLGVAGGRLGGVVGAVLGLALAAAAQCALLARTLAVETAAHGVRISVRGAGAEVDVLRRFLAPSVINSLVAYSALWGASALLVRQPDGFQQLALFAAANSLRVLVLFVPAIVNNVALSLLSNQHGAGHARRYEQVFWTNTAVTLVVVVVGGAVVVAAGPWLLGVFGQEFRSGDEVLWWLMVAAVPETAVASAIQIAQSRERMWLWCVGVVVPCYGTLIALAAVLTPTAGARGLALSYVGAMAVALLGATAVVVRLGLWADPPGPAER